MKTTPANEKTILIFLSKAIKETCEIKIHFSCNKFRKSFWVFIIFFVKVSWSWNCDSRWINLRRENKAFLDNDSKLGQMMGFDLFWRKLCNADCLWRENRVSYENRNRKKLESMGIGLIFQNQDRNRNARRPQASCPAKAPLKNYCTVKKQTFSRFMNTSTLDVYQSKT